MIVLLIILCVLLTAVIVLSVWGYTLLSRKIDYVYGNQSVLYQKILEAEIPVMCSYLGVLETARREALADERYEDVQRLIETIRYNTGTLEQLRREYSMMRKDSRLDRFLERCSIFDIGFWIMCGGM